jgi:hypothetical protein
MTYIGFHDDARIHTQNQKSWIEAPVVEFFGHAELDSYTDAGAKTKITVKADSLIFHDSVIFNGTNIALTPYTTGDQRNLDMRYGVVNDRGPDAANYGFYGPAIAMEDRGFPVIEFGYQRCNIPSATSLTAPNMVDNPPVGGDVVVTFKHGFSLPIVNTVVANHARISFITDSFDHVKGGEFVDATIRTDLLRIRNKVEFYTDPTNPVGRIGKLMIATPPQIADESHAGIYTRHLHTEPGSELSVPGEDALVVLPTTVIGGFGTIHENVLVKAGGILAPGYASLMEGDCQSSYEQGRLRMHNLKMEDGSVLRVSFDGTNTITGQEEADVFEVDEKVYMTGKIKLEILTADNSRSVESGCYLVMQYGDSTSGPSPEYVKNLELERVRYNDTYFSIDLSHPGKVYLCASKVPNPTGRHRITIHSVEGVTTNPAPEEELYIYSRETLTFTAKFGGSPLKVTAKGFYTYPSSGYVEDLDKFAVPQGNNTWQYSLGPIVEPWDIYIGPALSTAVGVSNNTIVANRVWAYRNTLNVNVESANTVSIYTLTGALYLQKDVAAGLTKLTLERGAYVVTLKDGTKYKIVIN